MDGTRLKNLLKTRKITQARLAEIFEVNPVTESRWITGDRDPSDEVKVRLAEYFNVTTDYLMGREEPEQKKSPPELAGGRFVSLKNWMTVPVISREWTACCGGGIPELDVTYDSGEYVSFPRENLRAYDDSHPPFGIHCEGDCMESIGVGDGDIAVVNPAERPPVNGTIALVCRVGGLSLKRFYQLSNGDVYLVSDDGKEKLTPDDQEREEFYVIGALVAVIKGRPRSVPL